MKKYIVGMMMVFVLLSACSNSDQTKQVVHEENKEEVKETTQEEVVPELGEQEVQDILQKVLDSISQVYTELGEEHSWMISTNPPDYDEIKPRLESYATSTFIEAHMEDLASGFYCECDKVFYPNPHPNVRFEFEQKEDVLKISGLEPATELTNMGKIWKFELIHENKIWKMNNWEPEYLEGQDLQLTKEEAESILDHAYEATPKFVTEYHSDEAGGTAYVFQIDDWKVSISSKDTSFVSDYPDTEETEENHTKKMIKEEAKHPSFSYETYTNSRFGFSVEYPNSFEMSPPPTNNDGREFSNGEATIIASGSFINIIEENETIETYYNRQLENIAHPIAYQRLGDDWYVISYADGEDIVYLKSVIGENIISNLRITYPSQKKDVYDPMVTRVSETFEGGVTDLVY